MDTVSMSMKNQKSHSNPLVPASKYREILEELSVQVPCEDFDSQSKLNPKQVQAFNDILQRVDF